MRSPVRLLSATAVASALLLLSAPFALADDCVMRGGNLAGCATWTTCGSGPTAYVQQRCAVDDGDGNVIYLWSSYTMSSIHAGCAGCTGCS